MTDASGQRAELSEIARKLVLRINEITPAQWDERDQRARAIILAALQTTRQKALREAAKLVNSYNCMHNHGTRATKACDDIFEQLDRLAREGVKG